MNLSSFKPDKWNKMRVLYPKNVFIKKIISECFAHYEQELNYSNELLNITLTDE